MASRRAIPSVDTALAEPVGRSTRIDSRRGADRAIRLSQPCTDGLIGCVLAFPERHGHRLGVIGVRARPDRGTVPVQPAEADLDHECGPVPRTAERGGPETGPWALRGTNPQAHV